jgi:CubicO group peptidase (beta-lactamase class C family)
MGNPAGRPPRASLLLGALLIVPLLAAREQPPPAPDFSTAHRAAADLPQLRSLLVSWRGERRVEYYAAGAGPSRLANVKSASKSLISALIGIAIDRGLLPGVHEPIVTFFPALKRDPNPRKAAITLEDLLTMRSGLESTSGPRYGPWVRSRDWVRYVLSRPLVGEPGSTMEYSTGTSHLLSAVLTQATGRSTWAFAQETLARPLGFTLARWPRDPQGIYFGGNEMLLTPRQMVSVGELYLNGGRVAERQVIPASWVETSCVPRTASQWDRQRLYGYGWWVQEVGGYPACFAWGFGGQYILVFRDLDLVVTATSSTAVSDERGGHRRRLLDLIAAHVIAPIVGESRAPSPR